MQLGKIFSYYWKDVKKFKNSLFLVFFFYGVGIILAHIVGPIFFKKIIDIISNNTPSLVVKPELLEVFFYILGIIVLYNIAFRIADYAVAYFEANTIREIHNSTFKKLSHHSYKFFSNTFAGGLVAKAKRFTRSFENISDIIFYHFWFTFIELLGIFVVLFIEVPGLGFLFLTWSAVYIFITLLFVKKKVKLDLVESAADSKVTAYFADVFSNIFNVKIFSSNRREREFFGEITEDEYKKRKRAWYFGNFQFTIQAVLMAIFELVVIYLLIDLWSKGGITTGTFVLTQTYVLSLLTRLWNLGKGMSNFYKAVSSAKEMVDILDKEIDIKDPNNPEKVKIKDGYIEFKKVFFEYDQHQSLLNDFNLKIKPGEHVGLVGHSGAGKSTITKLLLRFSDVTKGSITIDGQDIRDITQDDLRSKISYVPQEPILFHRSIKENLSYAKDNVSFEEVKKVAKMAYVDDFVSNLPEGYETKVGERGVKLSGGERQRVAVARAMLEDAPVIILDEATSSLDSISEKYIQNSFERLMKGRTAIVIAHRLSTIMKMDRIIVLEDGLVAEEGTHGELLEKNGVYKSLWEHQRGGFVAE